MHGDTKHIDKSFTVAAGGTVRIRMDVGDIRVKASDGNTVTVSGDLRGRARDLEQFEFTSDQSGNDVTMRGEFKGRGGRTGFGDEMDARWTVSVPKAYNVELHTAGGDVEIVGVNGDLRGGTSGGDVRVSDVRGTVELETSGGDVTGERITGPVHLSTSGGEVHAKSIVGDIDLRTSGGDVTAEGIDGAVSARTSGGNVLVNVAGANKGVKAETSGGDIELVLAKSVGAEIDISTSGGEVTCDIPVTVQGKISEESIRGMVNGGGPKVYAHTSGGNVKVRSN
jgi:DUF4097 and DUF4098 domain-containing protein YvlB